MFFPFGGNSLPHHFCLSFFFRGMYHFLVNSYVVLLCLFCVLLLCLGMSFELAASAMISGPHECLHDDTIESVFEYH